MSDLLLEILSEEIPARMQQRAARDLRDRVLAALAEHRVEAPSSRCYATPRRLVLALEDLPRRQPDLEEERKGPRVGAPDRAVAGFAGSLGIPVAALERRDTAKGSFWFALTRRAGRPLPELLGTLLPAAMADLPWPRSMRWGSHDIRWVRPIVSVLALSDGVVVPMSYGPLRAGDSTCGHRFLAPERFSVTGFQDYRRRLEAAYVVLDADERRRRIREDACRLAAAEDLVLQDTPRLLDEIAGLVEWPVTMIGGFDESFMSLPSEILVSAMTRHQRHLPLRRRDGALARRFVMVANMAGGDRVRAGHERVLAARLADGRHFWARDRRRRLEDRVGDLDRIVFHARLGSLGAKAGRLSRLASELAASIPGCESALARRAALLAKADLASETVAEFPELQGVLGGHHAEADGEDDAVARAVREHHAPQGPSDRCPRAPVGVAVALADKIDTLAGFFAIGERPTGSRDPFGLRRAALGVVRLILENALRLELRGVFERAALLYPGNPDKARAASVADDLMDFVADRLKVHLRATGVRHDLVDAVFRHGGDDLVGLQARVAALGSFVAAEDGANLLAAYRRAANIVRIEERRDRLSHGAEFDREALVAAEETALAEALAAAAATAVPALQDERFDDAMTALARLRRPVDAFFDRVTVNTDDEALRRNRLRLLAAIGATLDRVADFSRIEGPGA